MPQVELDPGEREKIISQPGRGTEWDLAVEKADVAISHRQGGVVREGRRLTDGDRVSLSNLDGQSVYAKAPVDNTETALVDVNEASFAIIFQTRGRQAPPSQQEFVSRADNGIDVSSSATVEEFDVPPGAEDVAVFAETGGSNVDVDVQFDSDSNKEIGPTFSGSGDEAVAVEVATFGESCDVTFDGAATNLDYRIYCR